MQEAVVLSIGSDARVLGTRELILRSADYNVTSATSVKAAVHLLQDNDFSLIVLCHTLPRKDGERLTSAVRALGLRIPIVCVSGTALAERNSFADVTVDKDPVAFLGAIDEILRNHHHTDTLRRKA